MKVAFLTSSRADYGIVVPLLKAMKADAFFTPSILAFGTHLSTHHGQTIRQIEADGFEIAEQVETTPADDSPGSISKSMGEAMIRFSDVWNKNSFDLIIALGDRYEMFAACASAVSFGTPIAHIHGGETTTGAIDDVFRHCITQMATFHFATTDIYKQRVVELKGTDSNVHNVGALSVDNLCALPLLSKEAFKEKYSIDLSRPSILITFHPETVAFEKNDAYIDELIAALTEIDGYQFIITMPNADTTGDMIRGKLQNFIKASDRAIGVESFGTLGYLSCMKHCSMLLGNTSSGFVEAAFFPKYVINLGDRQNGRITTQNITNCKIEKDAIKQAVAAYKNIILPADVNIYGNGTAARQITTILKSAYQK